MYEPFLLQARMSFEAFDEKGKDENCRENEKSVKILQMSANVNNDVKASDLKYRTSVRLR